MELLFTVRQQTLTHIDTRVEPRVGSSNYLTLKFIFTSPDWKSLRKTVHLSSGDVSTPYIIEGDTLDVPAYFTQQPSFDVTLLGDSGEVIVPTNVVTMELDESNTLWTSTPPDPQDSAYLELLKSVGNINDLATEDKTNLVAAINEIVATGGGNGVTEHSKLKGRNEPDQHPIEAITGLAQALADKLNATELPEAINEALAQAKASGEFKGDKGDPGTPGKDGQNGKDGAPGQPGKDGQNGKTPVKGVDYFTPEDTEQIAQAATEKLGFDKQYVDEQVANRQPKTLTVTVDYRGIANHNTQEIFDAYRAGSDIIAMYQRSNYHLSGGSKPNPSRAVFESNVIQSNGVFITQLVIVGNEATVSNIHKYTPTAAVTTATVPSGITADGNVQSVLDALGAELGGVSTLVGGGIV